MNHLIGFTTSYMCNKCEKYYLYKKSYDKHKKLCVTRNDKLEEETMSSISPRPTVDNKKIMNIICLFFITLILEFIKEIREWK